MQTLRTIRRTRELTFLDLALLTGIPARVLAEAEYGLRHLSHHEAETIAFVLGIPPTAIRPLPPQTQARSGLKPLALAAGLATTLALLSLFGEGGQRFQHHLITVALQQVSSLLSSQTEPAPEMTGAGISHGDTNHPTVHRATERRDTSHTTIITDSPTTRGSGTARSSFAILSTYTCRTAVLS